MKENKNLHGHPCRKSGVEPFSLPLEHRLKEETTRIGTTTQNKM